jgi:hypothetical protein
MHIDGLVAELLSNEQTQDANGEFFLKFGYEMLDG